ncbi:MAG: L-seryl-tRNA(Sec) selenium transferase [Planctomycetota bacterium]
MTPRDTEPEANPYRLLPKVDEALREPAIAALEPALGREVLRALVQAAIEGWRMAVAGGALDAAGVAARCAEGALAAEVARAARQESGRGVTPCVNATGVVLHTNLGRAPVHPEVADAMRAAALGYCVLEVDRYSGKRNERDARLGVLLTRLTGAEAGIAVNNCAAAAFLMMQTFAGGREAIVSRGELVEIGGSFRVPDVMQRAGARLVEVGTTNRTRLADYARAIGPATGLLMKVHTSNFRVVGFTEEVEPRDMAALAKEHGIVSAWDLGSGRAEPAGARTLDVVGDETVVREAVASGVDAVCFSGDKLLGAPQAGLIVGSAAAIRELRKNPIYRAVRLDKVALAGLEATLGLLLNGRGDELPTRRMLLADVDELAPAAQRIAAALGALPSFSADVVPAESQPGSGSAPTVFLPTLAVRVRRSGVSAEALASELRAGDPPVFTRVQDDAVFLDPRALLPGDEARLCAAFRALASA